MFSLKKRDRFQVQGVPIMLVTLVPTPTCHSIKPPPAPSSYSYLYNRLPFSLSLSLSLSLYIYISLAIYFNLIPYYSVYYTASLLPLSCPSVQNYTYIPLPPCNFSQHQLHVLCLFSSLYMFILIILSSPYYSSSFHCSFSL